MRKIHVQVKPNAHTRTVEKIDDGYFRVSVPEPPASGLANRGVVKALAEYFQVAPSQVRIIKGFTSKQKVVQIG